jgi:hypothetical protein
MAYTAEPEELPDLGWIFKSKTRLRPALSRELLV